MKKANWMSILLKMKKHIFRIISILKSVNKKVFWKNKVLLSLFFTRKLSKTI